MAESYDVLIVGARVAGATLAAFLGDAGHRVMLVDRATFPSSTLSTHFFRGADAVSVLSDLRILDETLALGCPTLTQQYSYYAGSPNAAIESPQNPGDVGYCLSVRRKSLDALLVRRATANGNVDLLERTGLVELLREGERVTGARLRSPEGEHEINARLVVGADGRHSAVARSVAPKVEEDAQPARAMYYCYLEGFDPPNGGSPDGPEFSWLGDEIVYAFPSDAGVTCVALSVNLQDYAHIRTDAQRGFRSRIAAHSAFAERFDRATWVDRLWACGPEQGWVRVPHGPGWALVGDAGLHQDPWSGQGIDMATRHASFLAEEIDGWLSDRVSEADAMARYHQRRNEHALDTYHFTTEYARDLRPLSNANV